jgi:hypothetical protein
MKLAQFITAVDNLAFLQAADRVRALEKLYDEMREQTVHELAEAIRQRDEAMIQLHKKHLGVGIRPLP